MKKQISKLEYFLFHKEHELLGNKKLFRFQSDFTQFATTVSGTGFFKKKSEAIRPFVNQQLKVENNYMSKPIRNHFDTYMKIVEARYKEMKSDHTPDDIKIFLDEFKEYFNKDSIDNKEEVLLFGDITVKLLEQLQIVTVANGGSLTEKEFIKFVRNLKNLA